MALKLITQSELENNLADRTGWSKSDVRSFLSHLQDEIKEAVESCKRVKVAGIQVEPKLRAAAKARKGRNPRTGEEVDVAARPASVVLRSKIVKPLADAELPSIKMLRKRLGA